MESCRAGLLGGVHENTPSAEIKGGERLCGAESELPSTFIQSHVIFSTHRNEIFCRFLSQPNFSGKVRNIHLDIEGRWARKTHQKHLRSSPRRLSPVLRFPASLILSILHIVAFLFFLSRSSVAFRGRYPIPTTSDNEFCIFPCSWDEEVENTYLDTDYILRIQN